MKLKDLFYETRTPEIELLNEYSIKRDCLCGYYVAQKARRIWSIEGFLSKSTKEEFLWWGVSEDFGYTPIDPKYFINEMDAICFLCKYLKSYKTKPLK